MATRSLEFFMRPVELSSLVWEVADEFGLFILLVRLGPDRNIEFATQSGSVVMSDKEQADRVYLSTEQPILSRIEASDLRPGELGWIQLSVPREEGDVLFQAQMAAKSDWYDKRTGQVYENPAAIKLFDKVVPLFRRRLRRPVWAYNVLGGRPQTYRNIGYSCGAAEWVRGGGQLRQEGVANVRFSTDEPMTI